MVTVTEKRPRGPNAATKPSSLFTSASKIKAKIHNTSSFFKVSLKSNNKALAKALAVQSEKTRHLIQEIMLLRKRVQDLHIDLANQRHQKKELFAIIHNFYNTSIKNLDKATNLLYDENEMFGEDADVDHADDVMEMFGSLLEAHDKPPRVDSEFDSKSASQLSIDAKQDLRPPLDQRKCINSVASSDGLLPMCLSSKQTTNVEKEAIHQQTLVCGTEMEMTVVTSAAPIEIVETKTSKSSCSNMNITGKDEEPGLSTPQEEKLFDTGLGEENGRNEVIEKASAAVVLTEMQGLSSELHLSIHHTNTDVESAMETDFVVPRRKTHFTKRRNNRLTLGSHKDTENLLKQSGHRKTYVISQKPESLPEKDNGCSEHYDFGGIGEDASSEVDSAERQHHMKTDVLSQCQRKNSMNRKTYVISDRAAFKKSRKSDLLLITGQKADCVTVMESSYEAQNDQIPIEPAPMRNTVKKRKTMDSLSATNQDTRMQRREKNTHNGGIRCSIEGRKSYFDEWCDFFADDDQQKASIRVISTLQNSKATSADIATDTLKNSDENTVPHKVPSEHPVVGKPWKISDFLADGEQMTSKKSRKANKGKSKEKKYLQSKKAKGSSQDRRQGNIPKSRRCNEDLVLDETDPITCVNKSQIVDTQHSQDDDNHKALEVQHSPSEVHASTESGHSEKTNDAIHFRSASSITNDEQTHIDKLIRRGTFVISTCPGQGNKENYLPEEIIPTTNMTSLKSTGSKSDLFSKRQTFVYPINLNESEAPLCQQTELLSEERPPWESLDFGCTSPFPISTPTPSPPSMQPSNVMEIYQEASPTKSNLTPESRPMKSLTNTNRDLTDVGPGRTRRKGATVSYKEPSLNLKMRRGDKFSDPQFLRSPVFKGKKIKKKHKA